MKLTTKQVCEMFNVTPMTIWKYRNGTPTKEPLPCTFEGRNVLFKESEVRTWAKRNHVEIVAAGPSLKTPKRSTQRARKRIKQ